MVKRVDDNPTQLTEFCASDAELAQTLATIQKSEIEIVEGKERPAESFFDELRTRLLNMQPNRHE